MSDEGVKIASKGLIYTKKNYEDILSQTDSLMHTDDFNSFSRHDIQYIYGIYYDAFAGLLRSGALCSRRTGKDGMPDLVIPVGISEFTCHESIIRALLGDEADEIIDPYENTFSSYAGGRSQNDGMGDTDKEGRREKKLKKNSPEAKIQQARIQAQEAQKTADSLREELKKLQKETLAQVEEAKNQAVDIKIALDEANKKIEEGKTEYKKLEEIHKDSLARFSAEQQEKQDAIGQVQELEEEIGRLRRSGGTASDFDSDMQKQIDGLRAENERLKAGSADAAENERLRGQLIDTENRRKDIAARYESLQKSTADQIMQKEKDLKEALDMADYAKKTLRQKTEIGAGRIFVSAALAAASAGGLAAAVQFFLEVGGIG